MEVKGNWKAFAGGQKRLTSRRDAREMPKIIRASPSAPG